MSRPDRGGPLARWLPPLAIIVALLAVWEIAVRVAKVPDWLLPPPSAVAATLVRERDLLLANARVTLAEVLPGPSSATARPTRSNRSAPSAWPAARSWTT